MKYYKYFGYYNSDYCRLINAGSDLNQCIAFGTYVCTSNDYAVTLKNNPAGDSAFALYVTNGSMVQKDSKYIYACQYIMTYQCIEYRRMYNIYDNKWTSWYKIDMTAI